MNSTVEGILLQKCESGFYKSTKPYPSVKHPDKQERDQMIDAYREDSQLLEKRFTDDCRMVCDVSLATTLTDEQFKAMYHSAWESGHAFGYHEVVLHLLDVIEVVRPFIAK